VPYDLPPHIFFLFNNFAFSTNITIYEYLSIKKAPVSALCS